LTIRQIASILNAEICVPGPDLDQEITIAYASDMMADVLAFAVPGCALITGLRSQQVIRSAELKDLACIIFSRGKIPDSGMIELARTCDMSIMYTKLPMFTTSGLLYEHGIRGVKASD
jgi:hypothetical protein